MRTKLIIYINWNKYGYFILKKQLLLTKSTARHLLLHKKVYTFVMLMRETRTTADYSLRLSQESQVVAFSHKGSIIDNATTPAIGRYGRFLCVYST